MEKNLKTGDVVQTKATAFSRSGVSMTVVGYNSVINHELKGVLRGENQRIVMCRWYCSTTNEFKKDLFFEEELIVVSN